nr:EOG090X0A6P [Triops cancriformis]
MPLPSALASRLAKRGLLTGVPAISTEDNEAPKSLLPPIHVEETIAEDYGSHAEENEFDPLKVIGYSGCPNKWNINHECVAYCRQRWGEGKVYPDPEYEKLKEMMLAYYPLPDGWHDVYDAGTGFHYYWDVNTDQVSWFPPYHPKFHVSLSAAKLRANLLNPPPQEKSDEDMSEDEEERKSRFQKLKEDREKRQEMRNVGKGKSKVKFNDLDPMDPASYSDVPKGTWADGLETGDDAKTGVDSTASGPLFQMRPYPSPGAILKANAAKKK